MNAKQANQFSDIAEKVGPAFRLRSEPLDGTLPLFEHIETGIDFLYIPTGSFLMGLGEKEEQTARKIVDPPPLSIKEMRPVTKRNVNGFLLSRTPVLNGFASQFISLPRSDRDSPFTPCRLTREEAVSLLERLGFRLPTETEWEYSCRAGADSLFAWGDHIPDNIELERWLALDLSNASRLKANNFGLLGLYCGEWCEDVFYKSHLRETAEKTDSYVVRGGGAVFWEWQDQEWVWCMSAMRMPSADLPDGQCAFRLALTIDD